MVIGILVVVLVPEGEEREGRGGGAGARSPLPGGTLLFGSLKKPAASGLRCFNLGVVLGGGRQSPQLC